MSESSTQIIPAIETIEGELVPTFCTLDDIKLLRNKYQGLSITPGDTDSYDTVKAALTEVMGERVGIEKSRKALKQKALDYGRALDAEARDLTEAITPLEQQLRAEKDKADAVIEDDKAAKKAAKAAAEKAEADRVLGIRAAIAHLKETPLDVMGKPSGEIEAAILQIRETEPHIDQYGEFLDHALRERTHVITTLVRLHDQALETEQIAADNERLRQEKEQADKQRDQAERDRKAALANAAARVVLDKIANGDAAHGGFMGPILAGWTVDGTADTYTSDEALLHALQAAGYKAEQEQAESDRHAADAAKHQGLGASQGQPHLSMVKSADTAEHYDQKREPATEAQMAEFMDEKNWIDCDLAWDLEALKPLYDILADIPIPLDLRTEAARMAVVEIVHLARKGMEQIDQLNPALTEASANE